MKTNILVLIAIAGASLQSFAQEKTKGFYVNPNVSLDAPSFRPNQFGSPIRPSIGLGYLHGDKIRHNISLNALSGVLRKSDQQVNAEIRYSIDYLLLGKKRFSLYLSPFVKAGILYAHNKYHNGNSNNYSNRGMGLYTSAGISPQLEFEANKKIHFTFALPITLLGYNHQSIRTVNDGIRQNYQNGYAFIAPSLQANVGMRVALFNKRK